MFDFSDIRIKYTDEHMEGITMALTQDQIKQAKGMGFLLNRGTECFSGRVITENGVLTSSQLQKISEAAEKFGKGTVAFTTRLTVEIPGISYENIPRIQEYMKGEGLSIGGTGPKIRPIVACKGTTCVYGLHDTQALAKELHDQFYLGYRNVVLPHKFKIAVGGCPNNCVKPELNDIGIVGQKIPVSNQELCKGCKTCQVQEGCPVKAASLKDEKIVINKENCINCGLCTIKCPFQAILDTDTMYRIYIGGRWGKSHRKGDVLSQMYSKEELCDVIEKIILLYRELGQPGERFASMIERIGLGKIESLLETDDILKRKDIILG